MAVSRVSKSVQVLFDGIEADVEITSPAEDLPVPKSPDLPDIGIIFSKRYKGVMLKSYSLLLKGLPRFT